MYCGVARGSERPEFWPYCDHGQHAGWRSQRSPALSSSVRNPPASAVASLCRRAQRAGIQHRCQPASLFTIRSNIDRRASTASRRSSAATALSASASTSMAASSMACHSGFRRRIMAVIVRDTQQPCPAKKGFSDNYAGFRVREDPGPHSEVPPQVEPPQARFHPSSQGSDTSDQPRSPLCPTRPNYGATTPPCRVRPVAAQEVPSDLRLETVHSSARFIDPLTGRVLAEFRLAADV
jgi:hypothetical protein